MATATGFDFVALDVRDLERSAAFYEGLGLRRAPLTRPNAVVFATQPIPFAVIGARVDLHAVDQPGLGVALWLACDDPDGLAEQLRAAGSPLVTEPSDGPFGRQFTFADPDGYLVTVHGA